MFALKPRTELATVVLLIVVILFNAVISTNALENSNSTLSQANNSQLNQGNNAASSDLLANFDQLPMAFIPNVGQEDADGVQFEAQGLGGELFFTREEVVFSLLNPVDVSEQNPEEGKRIRYDLRQASVLRTNFVDANLQPEITAMEALPGMANYLKGIDSSKWFASLPTYSGIIYHELYPGIELHYEGTGGILKSSFYVAAGSNPSAIIWKYKGADNVKVDQSGNLVITLPSPAQGEPGVVLTESAPLAWQEVNGNRTLVTVQYKLDKNGKVSFQIPNGYDQNLPLIIDPELTASTYLGGSRADEGDAITVDTDGNIYLTGNTASTNFPIANQYQTNLPSTDVFVTKLNPTASAVLYSTYLGGNQPDHGWGIRLDNQGRITLVGETESSDFPMVNAYDNTYAGGTCETGPCDDIFVAQLSPNGNALRYSTYLGTAGQDEGISMSLGSNDQIYLTGNTSSSDFPMVNAYDNTYGGGTCSGFPCPDAFIAKVDPASSGTASLLYSTYLGGNKADKGKAISLDSNGRVYVAGYTDSTDFPVRNAYQSTKGSASDIFVSKFDLTLNGTDSLLYSTYFGGNESDHSYGIAVNGADQVYFTGYTQSTNFPLANSIDNTFGGGTCGSVPCYDAYIAHLNIANNNLVYSTYLGGSNEDRGNGITLDGSGRAYVIGYTKSTDFPTVNAIQGTKGTDSCSAPPCPDVFVAAVNASGNILAYSTYLGGSNEDYGTAIILDSSGGTYLTGYTLSTNFPVTAGSYHTTISSVGYSDVFVSKISALQADATPTPTYTATATDTSTPTETSTPTSTATDTATSTPTPTFTPTNTPTSTPTSTPSPLEGATLTLTPNVAGPNVTGTTQTLTATLKNRFGVPLANVTMQFVVTGPNAMSSTAATNANGIALFAYAGANSGTDSIQAIASIGTSQVTSNTSAVSWVTPSSSISTTTVWGRFFTNPSASVVFNKLASDIPVFTQTFPTLNFNPVSGSVPGIPGNLNQDTRPFTNVSTDINGNYTGSIIAQGNGYVAGTGSLTGFEAVFTGDFVVKEASTLALTIYSDDGFKWGVGPDQNGHQPTGSVSSAGFTVFHNFPILNTNNGQWGYSNITINFPAAGTYPYEVDYAENGPGGLSFSILSGTQGVPPSAALTISPNTTVSKATGTQQTFTVTVKDASGAVKANLPVSLLINGVNSQQISAITDAAGIATFTYTGNNPGTDTIQALAWVNGIATYSPVVNVTWTMGTPPDPSGPLAIPGWIGSPTNQSTVSGIVPINLASGISLQQGTIDYWPADNPSAAITLASNVSGTGGATLATLDTTSLANGSYIIRLIGTNTSGTQLDSGILITIVGDYKPGRVRFTITDLTVPVAGLPITIGRTYDSLERNQVGDFGNGWTLAIGNPKLTENPAHDVTITMPDGKRVTFFFKTQSAAGIFGFLQYPRYVPEAGVYGSLTSNGCDLLVVSGGQYVCFPGGDYQPTEYTYTDPYGRKFVMDAGGKLKSITDLNNNVLTFSPDGITSSAGNLHVPFVRDPQGRITQIKDPENNAYNYTSDSNGDLASASLPGVTTPLTYTYDNHYFISANDPRGKTLIINTYYPDGRLKTEKDALNNTFQYTYDLNTNTTTVTNPDGGQVVTTYDSYGMVLSQKDPLNHTTTYTYFDDHNLKTQTDPLGPGHTTSYTYDSVTGKQTSVTNALSKTSYTTYNQYGGPLTKTDPLTNVQTIAYDPQFRPTGIGDSSGQLAGFTWNDQGKMLTRSDGNGKTTNFTYDPYGNLQTETDPLTHTTTYTYNLLGQQTSVTDARQNITSFEYDALGHIKKIAEPLGKITQYNYDPNGNRTLTIDPRSKHTTYVYDDANRLTEIHYPDTTSESYTYNWRGDVLTHTDQRGHVTFYEYDLAGRLIHVTYAYGTTDAGTLSYGYDNANRKISQTDPLGHITTYTYDNANHLLSLAAPLNHTTGYGYDDAGRRTSTTDADNHQTLFTYDVRGRLTRTTFVGGTYIQQTYDGNGNLLSRRDQGDKTTNYGYDDANRLTSVTDPLTHTTAYTYDAVGNLLIILDANSHQISFTYDALNRQTRKTFPDTSYEGFGYDLNDNLTSHRLADGNTNTYVYDDLNQLTQINYFDNETVGFIYTANGLRQTVTDARGTTNYVYDNRDHLTSITQPGGQAVQYTYNTAGNRLTLTTAAGTTQYGYDDAGRLSSATDPALGVTSYVYDNLGLRTQKNLPNGVTVDYTYDSLNRLTDINQHKGTTTLASYAYTLDPVGNRLSVTEVGGSIQWTYDDAHRLLSETRKDASNVTTYQATFAYDPVGNRASQTVNTVTTNYAYNNLDQMLTAGTVQYQYDDRGNLVRVTNGSNITQYTYDAANRLTGAALPGGTNVSYVYDADGHRVQQTVGSTVTNYLWDEASPYADVVLETNGSGSILASYVLGETELLSQTRSGTTNYYLQDGQGSMNALANNAGSVTDTYNYSAFGETFNHTGTTVNPYQYTGQQFDSQTGLYDLRARYYDPTIGRFLSQDTYSYNVNDPYQLNRYVYAANNAVNAMDPLGLQAFVEYSVNEARAEEEGAAVEPVGEEFASEAENLLKSSKFPGNETPFDADKLEKILKNLEKEGISVVRGAEAENILESYGAKAMYDPNGVFGNPRTLYFRENPSAPEVIEELLHVGQHRALGWQPISNVAPLEIEAQIKLLNMAKRLGWSSEEIAELYSAVDYWILQGGLGGL
jgi:RHS repeat-associated protein